MTIVDLVGQLPVHPQKRYRTRALTAIRRLAIHHTAGPATQTLEQIARYHIGARLPKKRAWPGIAYHYVISNEGLVYKCWPASVITYCVEDGNTSTLCAALLGDFSVHPPPSSQWNAAIDLARDLCLAYTIPITAVYGHREVPTTPPQDTACPGKAFPMDLFRHDLEAFIDFEEDDI